MGASHIFHGEFSGTGSLHIAGMVVGSIDLPDDRVVLGPGSLSGAIVAAREVVVAGDAIGGILAGDLVQIRATATGTGDVCSKRIQIAEGARFEGRINLIDEEPQEDELLPEPEAVNAYAMEAQDARFRLSLLGPGTNGLAFS